MKINNFQLIYLIFSIFFLVVGCSGNSINDYTTLKQKALEIPPDFELVPLKDKDAENQIESDNTSIDTDEKIYDIESLLSESLESSDDNSYTDLNNENQSSDDQQISIEEFISDQIENTETYDQQSEENVIINKKEEIDIINESVETINEENEIQNLIEENENSVLNEQNSDKLNQSSEETFLDELSDVEEIISLPEDEQLKSQRSSGSDYNSDEFLSADDLNDLLDRVDKLFEDQLDNE